MALQFTGERTSAIRADKRNKSPIIISTSVVLRQAPSFCEPGKYVQTGLKCYSVETVPVDNGHYAVRLLEQSLSGSDKFNERQTFNYTGENQLENLSRALELHFATVNSLRNVILPDLRELSEQVSRENCY